MISLRARAPRFRSPRLEPLEQRINLAAATYDLGALIGTDGFVLNGIDAGDNSGDLVSSAGDINGDGYDDLLIGARRADPGGDSVAGETYLVFGAAGGFAASLDLSTLNGTNGFLMEGIDANDNSGKSASGLGDINGDGFDDLMVAAWGSDLGGINDAGETYVLFGHAGGFAASFDFTTLNGTNGFVVQGIGSLDFAGFSVSGAGDVNGDGFHDLLIGAYGGDPGGVNRAGETYVVFGHDGGFAASLDLATLDGTTGFLIEGINPNDTSGHSVHGAGDVNGDGFGDLIIGAYRADPGGDNNAGESYVVFGQAGGFSASFDLNTLNGANGFELEGISSGDRSGGSVSAAGDLNGDGFDDVVVGASGAGSAGESYVVFGKASGFPASLDLSALDGTNGFVLNGITGNDQAGNSVSGAGDVNGDGVDDLLIAAYAGDPGGNSLAGETYVVFGQVGGFAASFDLSTLNGTNGFVIEGIDTNDSSGSSVSDAGDVNGDGFDDVLIGAEFASPGGNYGAGESYVFFGRDFTSAVTLAGDDTANLLTGSAAVDVIIAGQDDDTLIGAGGADVLRAGQGDDRIQISDATFARVDGGRGTDVLELGNFNLDLTTIPDNRLTGIEEIDLACVPTGVTLTLNQLELLNLSRDSNTLVVHGTAADSIEPGTGWTLVGTEVIGSDSYTVLTQGAATLKFDQDMATIGSVLAGDINADNKVDGLDANVISNNFLAGGATFSQGDINGDGTVDGIDANILSAHFLDEIPAETAAESQAAVADAALSDLVAANFLAFPNGGATSADGDFTGDGFVDGLDLNWLAARRILTASDSARAVDTLFDRLTGIDDE